MSPHVKFRANIRNNKRAVGDKLNSRWWPPPSWIYYYCRSWSYGLFSVYSWLHCCKILLIYLKRQLSY